VLHPLVGLGGETVVVDAVYPDRSEESGEEIGITVITIDEADPDGGAVDRPEIRSAARA
jgi:hypothetical protein